MGLGIPEVVVIAIIVVVLFGPAIAAFFLGYQFGKRRGGAGETPAREPVSADASSDPAEAPSDEQRPPSLAD